MRHLFWLASYPKSGNTWLRLFLANLRSDADKPVGINEIDLGALDNDRHRFDQLIGTSSDELTPDLIDTLRPLACRVLARRMARRAYSKTHDAYVSADGACLFPADATEAAIYVVRNPFDLAVSSSYFFDKSLDAMIDLMAAPDHALSAKTNRYQPLLRQQLGSWSDHVASWAAADAFPVLVVRYEDMTGSPDETFLRIGRFAYPGISPERVAAALAQTSFDALQAQERKAGFRENMAANAFFRSGRVGSWQDRLSAAQVDRIVADHHVVGQQFGYISEGGAPHPVTLGEAHPA